MDPPASRRWPCSPTCISSRWPAAPGSRALQSPKPRCLSRSGGRRAARAIPATPGETRPSSCCPARRSRPVRHPSARPAAPRAGQHRRPQRAQVRRRTGVRQSQRPGPGRAWHSHRALRTQSHGPASVHSQCPCEVERRAQLRGRAATSQRGGEVDEPGPRHGAERAHADHDRTKGIQRRAFDPAHRRHPETWNAAHPSGRCHPW